MILDLFKLDGKVALVTGAGQGLGQGMALGLAEAGADIASLDRVGCEGTCESVRALGRRYCESVVDLREATVEDLKAVVARIVNELGHIDILVNNAGTIRRTPAIDFSETDWDDVLQINLKAAFFFRQRERGDVTGGNHQHHPYCSGRDPIPSATAAKALAASPRLPTNGRSTTSMSMRLLRLCNRITRLHCAPIRAFNVYS
jgi:2-deoxy-D-gluconate 3-dehydrogenase